MVQDIFITLFLVFLNGFFVAAEFAIVKVRSSQIELKAQRGSAVAKLASHMIGHLDGYLAATQLGITLASLGLGWVGEPVVSKLIISAMHGFGFDIDEQLAHQIALPVAFAIITVLHIVFGELAPKSLAIQRAETTTLIVAYPLNIFYWVFRPFIWILNGFANVILRLFGIQAVHGADVHSSDELKYLIQQSSESGDTEGPNYDLIKNAFDFTERTVKQIMVPRQQVVTIDVSEFSNESIQLIIDEGFSRIPCYDKDIDNITGIIYIKDILAKMRTNETLEIHKLVRPVIIIPQNRKIGSLLKEFQQKHIHLAVVVNEFGGMMGIVTLEDIIEELVGEIQDEYDNEISVVEKVGDQLYKVIATASIDDINELLPRDIQNDEQYNTLAGIIIQNFGKIPNTSDKVVIDGYEITILKRIRNSISLVQLKDLSPE